MEFFIPGLLIFILAIVVSFLIIPRFTPLIVAILSIVFLTIGVYHHYTLFASEYRLSTWQQSLKLYAPAIMIGALVLYIIYSILSLFTGGSVPVPTIPDITPATSNTITESISNTLNNVTNSVSNTLGLNALMNTNSKSNANNNNNNNNTENTNKKSNNNNTTKNNLSRSFLETL
jgi:energy-coupling factor transporter transmembrane protein EcfT